MVASALALSVTVQTHADNWAQWRGPAWDSLSDGTDIPVSIGDQDKLLWRVPLPGPAGASPIVWEDQLFLTTLEGTKDGANMFLICIDTNGKISWKKQLEGANQNSRDNASSASPSPSTDGKHVWAMMGNGILHCFTVRGELVWKKDLQKEYGKFDIQFGMTTSPILDRGRIYLALIHGDMSDRVTTSVGHVIALDSKTGDEIWYHRRLTDGVAENTHSYASPSIYRDEHREYLITHGGDYVIGHSLKDGSEIWRCGGFNPKGDSYNNALRLVASPTPTPGMIVVPTAKRGPVLALKCNLRGDVTGHPENFRWKMPKGTPDVASPVVYEGYVYLADEKGVLVCLDAQTGEMQYRERLFASNHRSTPVAANGHIYITGRKGVVYVVEAGPTFKLASKVDLEEETTASPAISNGRIYVRTYRALYAFGTQ